MEGMQIAIDEKDALLNQMGKEQEKVAEQAANPGASNAGAAQAAEKSRGGGGNKALGATKEMAQAQGGVPLPDDVRKRMESKLKADFSPVRIHENAKCAEDVQAGAVTMGPNIFFAPGRGPKDERLLAHELAHVVQQGGAQPHAEKAKLGATNSGAEKEAEAVGDAVAQGGEVPAISSGHDASVARRGEAGVHQGIEMEAAGVGEGPQLNHDLKKQAPGQGSAEKGALEIYSGNWMRDYSQLNVPMIVDSLKGIPKNPVEPGKGSIGAKGAETLITSLLRAMAIVEFGPEVAQRLVTGQNIGAYRPEEHIDNPMGTSTKDLVTRDEKGELGGAKGVFEETKDKNGKPTGELARDDKGAAIETKDPIRDAQIQGSAVAGAQVDNPRLYEVSPAGLSNHIYNSTENAKNRFLTASRLGASPEGRMHMGAGLHIIEDYFSHSNYIEVALNSFIDRAVRNQKEQKDNGAITADILKRLTAGGSKKRGSQETSTWVDTMYDRKPEAGGKRGRQSITTGSFGGTDTKVSLAHVLLPKLPLLQNAIDTGVDKYFGLLDSNPEAFSTWDKLSAMAKNDRPAAAINELASGCDAAGIMLPVTPNGLKLEWTNIKISPGWFGKPWTLDVPSGVGLTFASKGVKDAILSYAHFYKSARDTIKTIQKYLKYAKYIATFGLQALIDYINEQITKVKERIAKEVKKALHHGIIRIIASLRNEDPNKTDKEVQRRGIGDVLHETHEMVEKLEAQTSVESRLKSGDLSKMPKEQVEKLVGPVEKDPNGGWKSQKALPPSHSEIGKDHPPFKKVLERHEQEHCKDPVHAVQVAKEEHAKECCDDTDHAMGVGPKKESKQVKDGCESGQDHKQGCGGHDHSQGSLFYGLHRILAVEADKHVMQAMQNVWAKTGGSLLGDGKTYAAKDLQVSVADMQADAQKTAQGESKRAKQQGFKHAQSDEKNQGYLKQNPEVVHLLNLVDQFVSHPDDSSWWRGIFSAYISQNAEMVAEHIGHRNKTRDNRTGNK